ncbi:VOC family protein [Mobilicoccus massiliensis]|uniref:VOC family protein n=1 Tax=Mobilicoccus massiliensis TaxID=1522310 RepID=UPI001596CF4E|nr:VOC family protein [Mobilicoccus massiliensis]
MTTPTTPCLWFDGDAEEAAEFYVSVFPDSRITGVQKIVDADHPTGMPVGSVLAISFELEGRPFFALNGGPGFPFTQAVSFQTFCATQAELDARWDALVEGGEPVQCSWLVDRFGLNWQVVPQAYADAVASGDQDVIGRVHAALLTMVKPDVAAIEAAARGE